MYTTWHVSVQCTMQHAMCVSSTTCIVSALYRLPRITMISRYSPIMGDSPICYNTVCAHVHIARSIRCIHTCSSTVYHCMCMYHHYTTLPRDVHVDMQYRGCGWQCNMLVQHHVSVTCYMHCMRIVCTTPNTSKYGVRASSRITLGIGGLGISEVPLLEHISSWCT